MIALSFRFSRIPKEFVIQFRPVRLASRLIVLVLVGGCLGSSRPTGASPAVVNVVRQAVGEDVLLDKDGLEERTIQAPVTLNEAQVSIVLSAISGGMYEIGDDLPTLGSDPERLALVTNPDLLAMAKLGKAALPLDLLTYAEKDEQPSVFLLHQDPRQSVLAVFNWTEQPTSHAFAFSDLKLLSPGHPYELYDSLANNRPIATDRKTIRVETQPAHSVRLIKIIDGSIPAAPPWITFQVPSQAKTGEEIKFSSVAARDGVPALAYRWDFGDGVATEGAVLTHAYTVAGNYVVRFTAEGLDGKSTEKTFPIVVSGSVTFPPPQRYHEPSK